MRRPPARATAALVAVLGASLLAGCGGSDLSLRAVRTQLDGGAVVDREPATWALTGLPAGPGADAGPADPILVLKLDNTAASAPQQGLGSADLVVEELVEGGMTRLAAFFQSRIPGEVGPVRSMRASDIGIVAPVGGIMVTSGAAPVTIQRVRRAGLAFVTEGSAGFFRETSRYAPYNLFTDLGDVDRAIDRSVGQAVGQADGPSDGPAGGDQDDREDVSGTGSDRPADYLPWAGSDDDLPRGRPAQSLVARFSAGHRTSWDWRGDHYANVDSYAGEGDGFEADTVLVLRVRVGDAGYRDPAGNPVPETKLEGQGEAMLFHDGRVVRGRWGKADLESPLELTTSDGALLVPPGHTWIELVPADGGEVTVGP